MWFIIVKYTEGLEVCPEIFTNRSEAEVFMRKIAKIDGCSYAVAHSYHWHRLTSNPNWETTEFVEPVA